MEIMTDKINELMALAWAFKNAWNDNDEAEEALKEALEAALKPHGVPDAYLCVDGRWIPADTDRGRALCFRMMTKLGVYTAPPAQTPPNKAELLCVCGAEWKWENRSWELVSTPPQTPPPRLTDEQIDEIHRQAVAVWLTRTEFARAIETAVRKQFFGDRDE